MTGAVRVVGLRVHGRHGVHASERAAGQDFVVDAELRLDVGPAAARDDLDGTVDYADLAGRLAEVVAGEPVRLLETLASRLLEVCLADPRVSEAEVTVHKPAAPLPVAVEDVSVTLRRPQTAVLALGSNLGDRDRQLARGLGRLADRVPVLAVSPVYESEPVGGPPQGRYLNAVVLVRPSPPEVLLAAAREAETAAGRIRVVRDGPRPLDVDVVHVPGVVRTGPDLTLPHPRAHERAFVLVPWLDVDPGASLPGRGRVADLLPGLDRGGLHARPDVVLR